MSKEVTPQDLREAITSHHKQQMNWASNYGDKTQEYLHQNNLNNHLAAFDAMAQDAENWKTINPSGEPQVLVPKAEYDAMAEKAEAFDKFEELAKKNPEVRIVNCETFYRIEILAFPNRSSSYPGGYTLAEALKAVPE